MRGHDSFLQLATAGVIWSLALCPPAAAQICDTPLTCPVPSPGHSCVSGQLYEMETSELVRAASPSGDPCTLETADGPCSIELKAFDGLSFYQNPLTALPLPANIVVDDCGFYLVSEFPTPTLGFVAITTDDASASDNLIVAASSMGISPGDQFNATPLYTFRVTTDQAWTDSAGDPFVGQTFSEKGVLVGIFFNDSEPAPGTVVTRNYSAQPSDDFYFGDVNPFVRSTVNSALSSTGTNGTALMVNSDLVDHGGSGGEAPGCEWPAHLVKSVPGTVAVQEFHSVDSTTGDPCSTRLFTDGFESGDTSAWSAAVQ